MRRIYYTKRGLVVSHSAKGTTWEDHKYIKRIDGLYYYPDSYEGGRHLSDEQKAQFGSEKVEIDSLSDSDIEKLAIEGIRGNFGNGQERMEALGAYYEDVQGKINQMIESDIGPTSISNVSEEAKEATAKAVKKSKGVDMDVVYSVYEVKKQRVNEIEKRKGRKS